MISSIIKRDGRVVPFNRDKIAFAVYRAAVAVGGRDRAPAELVTDDVVALLERRARAGAAPAGAAAGATSATSGATATAAEAATPAAAPAPAEASTPGAPAATEAINTPAGADAGAPAGAEAAATAAQVGARARANAGAAASATAARASDGEPAAPPAPATSGAIPTVEEVQDLVEKVLIERGHARTAKAYIIYRYEHALKREGRPSLTYSVDNIPYKVLWETLSWAADYGCTRLADLTAAIDRGRYGDLIAAAEEFYRRQIDGAVAVISGREPRPRVVIVAGPSSSGKTTTTLKLRARLEQEGWRLFPIAVDNYFYDLELHPRDPHGDYDFETPQALNLELFSRDLARILAGEEVRIPRYDFKSGRQQLAAEPVQVDRDTVLLIDSLHGLYPALTAGIPDQLKVGVYVETLSQIKDAAGTFVRWSDIRMLRRMVRDVQFRNYDARQTVLHWQYVRRAEMRHIIARLRTADAIVNSFLAYELPILKARLATDVSAIAAQLAAGGGGDHDDARTRISRVAALLDQLPAWPDERVVPHDSLLREFIGGSSYTYD